MHCTEKEVHIINNNKINIMKNFIILTIALFFSVTLSAQMVYDNGAGSFQLVDANESTILTLESSAQYAEYNADKDVLTVYEGAHKKDKGTKLVIKNATQRDSIKLKGKMQDFVLYVD